MQTYSILAVFSLLPALGAGCGPGSDLKPEDELGVTDVDGIAELSFAVPSGAHSVQLGGIALDGEGNFHVLEVADPAGEQVLGVLDAEVPAFRAGAQIPWGQPVLVVNVPLDEDGPVASGTWTIHSEITDADGEGLEGIEIEPFILTNTTPVADRSTVDIHLVDATSRSGEAHSAWLDSVLSEVSEAYAAAGITLDFTVASAGLGGTLDAPFDTAAGYQSLAAETDGVLLVLGETWTDGVDYRAGQVGTIPLALAPTDHSAVAVSVKVHEDYGQAELVPFTMIHELGHALGLLHTADFDAESQLRATDALDDTDHADTWLDSVDDEDICTNFMFPDNSCALDVDIGEMSFSPQQVAMMRRFTGMR